MTTRMPCYSVALLLLWAGPLFAQGTTVSDQAADQAALQQLDQFLNDPAARHEAGKNDPKAAQVNTFTDLFPAYAQQELNQIVMMIMRESKADAIKHANAYKQGGAQAAMASFSPAVRQRVSALEQRLAQDPRFNSAQNLGMMKSFIPAFLASPGS